MTKTNKLLSVNDIYNALDSLSEALTAIEHKVKHSRYGIRRKKIKAQVLDGKTPRDYKREAICRDARKKAHTAVSDTKRDLSNDTRKRIQSTHEAFVPVNPGALTLSEAFDFDFIEESVGWDVNWEFFDKPQVTPLSESLDIGTTKTGRKRKCKAIGIAEGIFAPITDPSGERVFSRNNRLYESDHWDYQLENFNFANRVNSRRMLGMIGHEDKKIVDQDLRDGKVSHVVSCLEIREDEEHGRYLWGRLEILNTEAGRNLREYYEQDIPLYVSSRGGGKLIDVPGKTYRKVDKTKYYCECFDVVKEPGFLDAAPIYIPISEENSTSDTSESLISELAECLGIDETKLLSIVESYIDNNGINEDKNMSKVNCNIDAKQGAEEIIAKLLSPMTEKIEALNDRISALVSDLNEESEAETETPAEEAPVEAAEPAKEEAPAEEIKEEQEAPAEEKAEEANVEAPAAEEAPVEAEATEEVAEGVVGCAGHNDNDKGLEKDKVGDDKKPMSFEKKSEINQKAEDKKAAAGKSCSEAVDEAKEDKKEEKVEDEKAEGKDEKKEDKKEVCSESEDSAEGTSEATNEEWAKEDPKETVSKVADLPKPALGGAPKTGIGEGAWAKEDPKETAPETNHIPDGKNPAKTPLENKLEGEIHAQEKKDAAAVNAGVEGGANVGATEVHEAAEDPAEEKAPVAQNAAEFTQQVADYKAMYEALKDEMDECNKTVDELLETVESFGKRHREVVQEANETKVELESIKEQLEVANKALNSYKLQEQFNITVEKATELLSSKAYEAVVEELKAAEAQKIEDEAQAKAEAVSESLSETQTQSSPVSRKAYSAFSATISESKETESISESVETPKRRRAYSAF